MSFDLVEVLAPGHTAVVTMELQRGVVGDLARMGALRDEAVASGALDRAGRLCAGARRAGARVVHCTAEFRPDRAGSQANSPLLAMSAKSHPFLVSGSAEAELVPELGLAESDLVVPRIHGLTPFTGTSLDQILRNLGVRTVVAAGVSLNVGVLGLVLSAVDLGYQVVLAADACAGVPAEFSSAIIDNTYRFVSTVLTVADVIERWTTAEG